jgi:hypothetical protein
MGFLDQKIKCKSCKYSWVTRTGGRIPARCPNCNAPLYGTDNYIEVGTQRIAIFTLFLLFGIPIIFSVLFVSWIITTIANNLITAVPIIVILFFASVVLYRKIVIMNFNLKAMQIIQKIFVKFFPVISFFIIVILSFILALLTPNQEILISGIWFTVLLISFGLFIGTIYLLILLVEKIKKFLKPDVRKEKENYN